MNLWPLKESEIELRPLGHLPKSVHVFAPEEVGALKAALAAGRPLLVRGEPGIGKSQLARAAAQALGRALISVVVNARTEARDLQWSFDAVRRLADAQVLGATGMPDGHTVAQFLVETKYVTPGPLWWAFDWSTAKEQADEVGGDPPPQAEGCTPETGTVLLIDELDKADSSVPNGLLESLGLGQFPSPAGGQIECGDAHPLVIITTNEERALPDAFLRRCFVLHLSLPREKDDLLAWLQRRGRAHFSVDQLADGVLEKAAAMLHQDREALRGRVSSLPGGAEYLDLLRAVAGLEGSTEQQLEVLEEIGQFALQKHPRDDNW